MLERLESRRLMAAGFSASQAGSQLAVSGQDITVYENPQVAQQVIARDNSTGSELTFNGITDVAITGSVSVDRIFFTGYTVNSKIFGGGGSDLITVSDEGTTAKSEVNGEGADDTITVLHSNDTKIVGDGGGDQIYINDSVKDRLRGQ
jgi:hypothetical protein